MLVSVFSPKKFLFLEWFPLIDSRSKIYLLIKQICFSSFSKSRADTYLRAKSSMRGKQLKEIFTSVIENSVVEKWIFQGYRNWSIFHCHFVKKCKIFSNSRSSWFFWSTVQNFAPTFHKLVFFSTLFFEIVKFILGLNQFSEKYQNFNFSLRFLQPFLKTLPSSGAAFSE